MHPLVGTILLFVFLNSEFSIMKLRKGVWDEDRRENKAPPHAAALNAGGVGGSRELSKALFLKLSVT